jgi:hypothetical protein
MRVSLLDFLCIVWRDGRGMVYLGCSIGCLEGMILCDLSRRGCSGALVIISRLTCRSTCKI